MVGPGPDGRAGSRRRGRLACWSWTRWRTRCCARPGRPRPSSATAPPSRPRPSRRCICASVNDAIVHGIPDRLPAARRRPGLRSTSAPNWAAGSATRPISFIVGEPAPGRRTAHRDGRAGPRGGHRGGGRRQPHRRHRARDRHGVPRGGLRHPGRLRRPRHRPPYARGPGGPQRGPPGPRHAAAPRHGPRDRADADRRAARTATTRRADGWTLRTNDGCRAAHAEHTVAITDDGPADASTARLGARRAHGRRVDRSAADGCRCGCTTIAEPPPRRTVSAAASQRPSGSRWTPVAAPISGFCLKRVTDGLQLGPQRAVPQARLELRGRLVALAGARRGDRVDQRQAPVEVARSGSAARW